jgi:hypothetical protein
MLKYLLFETPLMVFAEAMTAGWIVLLIVFRRIPVAFFTVVLAIDLVLFIVGVVTFLQDIGRPHPRGSAMFGPPAAIISIGNFATGLTCCAILAGLTLLGEAITRGVRNRPRRGQPGRAGG